MRIDLALVGFGNVARRFVRLLDEQRHRLAAEEDLEHRIVGIATRRHGAIHQADGVDAGLAVRHVEAGRRLDEIAPANVTNAFQVIAALALSSAPLRVVIETTTLDIRNGRPAIDHVEAALASGCHLVTANKGPAAFAYADLREQAKREGLSFLFEGAVMDGVPIFNLVRETMPTTTITAFRGIVNSTTNHILSALERGEAFAPALARMQALGIAEANPSLDVDGWDAAAKAAALANVFMDARITPQDVVREGLGPTTSERALSAKARGQRLRLVASGVRGQMPSVALTELPPDDVLAGMSGQANGVILTTDMLDDIAISQLGGDLRHTAYALLSDLVTVRRRAGASR
ncbi:MAG: homoserine dehydrogenase [Vicinamibacterales bacterium]